MTIPVHIDSNAWNFLFSNGVDVSRELPSEEFNLFMTREVEIEVCAIPDKGKDGTDNGPLKQYIRDSLVRNGVRTTATFGFAEATPPGGPATYAGFGQGTFQSTTQRDWYAQETVQKSIQGKKRKGSGLTGNQADAAVAAKAFDSVVLTCDRKVGPIRQALEQGGRVIFLSKDLLENKTLGEVVRSILNQ